MRFLVLAIFCLVGFINGQHKASEQPKRIPQPQGKDNSDFEELRKKQQENTQKMKQRVLQLKDSDYLQAKSGQQNLLLLYYSHDQISKNLNANFYQILPIFAKYDIESVQLACISNFEVRNYAINEGIKRFPTVIFFQKGGQTTQYEGINTPQDIGEWAVKILKNPLLPAGQIGSIQQMQEKQVELEEFVIFFGYSDKTPEYLLYRAQTTRRKDFQFFHTFNPELREMYNIKEKQQEIILFSSKERDSGMRYVTRYPGDLQDNFQVAQFLKVYSQNGLMSIKENESNKLYKGALVSLILAINQTVDYNEIQNDEQLNERLTHEEKIFFQLRERYLGRALLKIFNLTESNYKEISESFGFEKQQKNPPILLCSENKGLKTYKYVYDGQTISQSSVQTFLEKCKKGQLTPVISEEPSAELEEAARNKFTVQSVTVHTWQKLVMNGSIDVLVLFYSLASPDFQETKNKFYTLAYRMKDNPNIKCVRVDVEESNIPYKVKEFPSLKLFASRAKDRPIDLTDYFMTDEIEAEIKRSVSLPWTDMIDEYLLDVGEIYFDLTKQEIMLERAGKERQFLRNSGFRREEEGVVGDHIQGSQGRGSGQLARKGGGVSGWLERVVNAVWLLRFTDGEIERKYFEDEYLRVIQMLSYQVYLGILISVVMVIMAFVASEYALLLGATAAVLIIPIAALVLAKKFPYQVNWLLSSNNIAWCILICVVYIWRDGSLVQKCGQTGYYQSSSVTDTTSASCSHIFVIGGGFYALHVALLIGTNLSANLATFVVINAVYVLSILPSIPYLVCFLVVPPVVVGITKFAKEKNTRLYYELINKYYIWYHIANNVLPQKIIVTKAATPNVPGTPREGAYQLVKANRRARKEFGINSTEQLQQFISQVELKQETHQSVPAYPDDNVTQNLAAGGRMDSLHSKSLGVISQFSKKSFTSRQSQLQGISGISGNRPQARMIPLDLLMKREIRRQNSNDGNNQHNQVDQQSSNNNNNLPGMHYISHSPANNNNNFNERQQQQQQQQQPQQQLGGNNNTTSQWAPSMVNPSQKQRGMVSGGRKISQVRRLKQEKYKCVLKREGTTAEEPGKLSLTLISYFKDEQYQLLMIEDDQNMEREQALEEQIVLYKGLSLNFGNIMMSEENLLLFYLQQMRQNYTLQKKISDFMADAFCLNAGVTNRISSFIEFYNFEAQKQELNPRQFSLKKLIRETASSLDFRIKQNQIQIVFSNDAPPELDLLFNDDKRLRHVLYYLLADCVQHSQKTQIIISTSSGVAEQGDSGDIAFQGTVKVTIRDGSTRKYKNNKNNDYFFATSNLKKIQRNKSQSYSDIELSVCKQLLGMIGPQTNIFYMSEDSTNSNKVSFYIYADLLQEGINVEGLNVERLDAAKDEVYQDEEDDEEEENAGFQQQIQNSDDDTYKNNQSPERPKAAIPADQNLNNAGHSSNHNPSSSIYIGHNLEQQQSRPIPQQQLQQQSQPQLGSGLLFSTAYQLQQQPQQQIPQQQQQQSQQQYSSSNHSNDKYGIPGTSSQTQLLQQQLIQFSSSQIPAQPNGVQSGNPSLNSQPFLGQLPVQSTTSALVGILPQSASQFSVSTSNNHLEKHYAQTQPDRKAVNPETRKSTSQLFEESDQVDDENPVSDIFTKDLSLTSVKFKREISKQLSLKTNLFKPSSDDIETNTRVSLSKMGNHPFSNSLSGLHNQALPLSNIKTTSKSAMNNIF